MSRRGEALVVILNSHQDMQILQTQSWYRIPVDSVEKYLKQSWAPEWLAFYQTKIFADEAYAVRYYARVASIQTVERRELFSNEAESAKSGKRYYRLQLTPLEKLPVPIVSPRRRRVLFIPTTFAQLTQAKQLKDLVN